MIQSSLEAGLCRLDVAALPVALAQVVPGLHQGRVELHRPRQESFGLRAVIRQNVQRSAFQVKMESLHFRICRFARFRISGVVDLY